MEGEKYTRQLDLIDANLLDKPIVLIGAGGIGSWSALMLCKMGCKKLKVYDGDTVDIVNTNSQLYGENDIDRPKVEALADTIYQQSNIMIEAIPEYWTGSELMEEIIITGLDSMGARQKVWEVISQRQTGYYIDGRMGGDVVNIFIVDLSRQDQKDIYAESLQLKVEQEACTGKAVVYNTAIIGGTIADLVKHIIKRERTPNNIFIDLKEFEYYAEYTEDNA